MIKWSRNTLISGMVVVVIAGMSGCSKKPPRGDAGESLVSRSVDGNVFSIVPVRKPGRQDWFRVNPDPAYRLVTLLIAPKDDRELYLVDPALQQELALEGIAVELLTVINRQRTSSLWPLRLPDASGRTNDWHTSARMAASQAERVWTRMVANMNLRAYELFEAIGDLPEPEWPTEPFPELFKSAFQGKLIDTADHQVVQRLLGKI